jgi:hypothetical protein
MPEPTVPIAANGLEGWTSCCWASVTFTGDGVLCCKGCWREVQPVEPEPAARRELGEIVMAVIEGRIAPSEGAARQRALDIGAARPTAHEGTKLDLTKLDPTNEET